MVDSSFIRTTKNILGHILIASLYVGSFGDSK